MDLAAILLIMTSVILVHGFLGFDRLFGIDYFKGVAAQLKSRNPLLQVGTPKLDPDAPIRDRTEQLLDFLRAWTKSIGSNDKVHVIAHSMGGLDARYLISAPEFQGHKYIRSLTTLGTPHWGTPVADWIVSHYEKIRGSLPTVNQSIKTAARDAAKDHEAAIYLLDVLNPFDGGIQEMTTEAMEKFNKAYPNHEEVAYFSIAGKSGDGSGDVLAPLLLPFQKLISECDNARYGGDNDGLVSVGSARGDRLGNGQTDFRFLGTFPADHFDLIGHDWSFTSGVVGKLLNKKRSFDHLSLYEKIFENVQKL